MVELTPGQQQNAHRSQLQPHVDDVYASKPFPMHYFTGKAQEVEPVLGEKEYIVEDGGVLKALEGENGVKLFVKWRGYEAPTWQPIKDLINDELQNFLEKNGYELTLERKKGKKKKNN